MEYPSANLSATLKDMAAGAHRNPEQLLLVVARVLPYDGALGVGEDLVANILHSSTAGAGA